jgi:hypothetical protein
MSTFVAYAIMLSQVDHFSRYGVPMDEDSDEGEEIAEGGDMEDGFGTPGVCI